MEEHSIRFHLEEYRALRDEIMLNINEFNIVFRFHLTAIAAIVSWIFLRPAPEAGDVWMRVVAIWVPVFICSWYTLQSDKLTTNIKSLASYVEDIEKVLAAPGLGWEGDNGWRSRKGSGFRSLTRHINLGVFIVCLLLACYSTIKFLNFKPLEWFSYLK